MSGAEMQSQDAPAPSRGWTLITGASSGLGVEFARIAARGGHKLILTARSTDKLERLAAELGARVDVVVLTADLSQPGAAADLWRRASEGREIDILVNNAGFAVADDFGAQPQDETGSLNVNVVALTELAQCAVAAMRPRGSGRILNVASVAGYLPVPGMAVYAATKAYVLSLSEALSSELKDTGVTVTVLSPGTTDTGFFDRAGMTRSPGSRAAPGPVAQDGWDALVTGRDSVVSGLGNKLGAFLARLMPRGLAASVAKRAMKQR
ncbi:SDR family NAD(P)-dependent oxidoreductase [Pseudoroseicyclus aestuarii]|uniref:Short-subunit dehydrogenase n=1 Tax=Pseudoroseicyclus aestuarii TaxID=1795041 RepID=A0A318SMF3_9RHOB|nr:SDR family oxidoreductase [Pseudoroseicyclus aestuarii]PYE81220.1 hypothetical protein DFP88_1079 [Pseudoroseicyclus aestuarii]